MSDPPASLRLKDNTGLSHLPFAGENRRSSCPTPFPPPPPAPEPEPEPEPVIPDSVSARQFKLQLLAAGLLDQVEGWIATQDQAVQIAYDNSGSFVRTEPMMQTGFAALGFTAEQIDAFFTAAALL